MYYLTLIHIEFSKDTKIYIHLSIIKLPNNNNKINTNIAARGNLQRDKHPLQTVHTEASYCQAA